MPRVASFCADFLKADMQHIYRQVSDLKRWECHVITRKRENEALFPWKKKRLRLLPKSPWRFFRRLWFRQIKGQIVPPSWGEVKEFLYHVMRIEAEVVHVYFGHIAAQWLRALQTCPKPVVVSFHGADAASGVDAVTMRQVFAASTLVLGRSQALLDDLAALGCPLEKLRLQRTGVPLDFWAPPSVPRAIPPADGAWRFVQTCRFVPKKGLTTTLQAFAMVLREFPQAKLTLIGDGPEKPKLDALIQELHLSNSVEFPGFLTPEGIRAVLHQSHFFIHPSETPPDGNREGVPNSLLEAMATGLPILATKHGGIPEAVDEGISGHLVAERDAEGLGQAALSLCQNPKRWAEMGRAGRESVMERFERQAQTDVLERCYDEAVSPRA